MVNDIRPASEVCEVRRSRRQLAGAADMQSASFQPVSTHGYHKQGAAYGHTHKLGYRPLLATRADTGEMLHARQPRRVP
jgi:hypothetical protein